MRWLKRVLHLLSWEDMKVSQGLASDASDDKRKVLRDIFTRSRSECLVNESREQKSVSMGSWGEGI
jgi:hypothetical protein